MAKNHYWLTDPAGNYALVEGAEERDRWARTEGWAPAPAEPGPTDQVHVKHPEAGRGRMPYGSLEGGFTALGWKPGPPPPAVDFTKDPALVDQPPAAVDEAASPKTETAAGGEQRKETSRG